MGRRRKQEEHVNHERWLVSYADFITLLFAFFVVMYAISELDKRKMVEASESFKFALATPAKGDDTRDPFTVFDARAKLPFGSLDPVPQPLVTDAEEDGTELKEQPDDGVAVMEKLNEERPAAEAAKLNRLRDQLESSIFIESLDGGMVGIEVDLTKEGLRIRLPGDALFDGRGTQLTPEAWSLLGDIATTLRPDPRKLRIDGHEATSDAVEAGHDWELSLLRSTRIARLMISRGGVQPARINAAGYGHHRPVSNQSTPEANRRYDIIVLARQ